jgi:hypothetical protein
LSDATPIGFDYELEDEVIRRYQEKPLALRLEWLYMGALLRQASPARTRELHDRFRANPWSDESDL